MKHLNDFTAFINESKLKYQANFLTIVKKLSMSSNDIVKEVALLLLNTEDFNSKKFKREVYSVDIDKNDMVMFDNQPIKLGKLLVSMLPDVKLFKIEQFVQVYKSTVNGELDKYNIMLYEGANVLDAYKTANYAYRASGDLHSSCMNDDLYYLEMYTINRNIKIAVSHDKNEKICARSLVWKATDGNTYHDRIYSITASDKESLIDYFAKNRIISIPNADDLTVELDTLPKYYPYVDSFRFINTEAKTLHTHWLDSCNGTLDNTDGTMSAGIKDESEVVNYIEDNLAEALSLILDNGGTVKEIFESFGGYYDKGSDSEKKELEETLFKMYNGSYDLGFLDHLLRPYIEEDTTINIDEIFDIDIETLDVYNILNGIRRATKNTKFLEDFFAYVVEYTFDNNDENTLISDVYDAYQEASFLENIMMLRIDLYTLANCLHYEMDRLNLLQKYCAIMDMDMG